MKFQQVGALFCCILVISGCASNTSHDFFMNRYSVDTDEFDRGYKAGIAFAKTEGPFNSSPEGCAICDAKNHRNRIGFLSKRVLSRLSRSESQEWEGIWHCFLGFIHNSYDRSHCSRHSKRRIVHRMCKNPIQFTALCVGDGLS